MPRFDGTGPRGEGMFTGRGEGYCSLRLPEPGSREPAVGYAGIQGRSVQLAPEIDSSLTPAPVDAPIRLSRGPYGQGRPSRLGKRCRVRWRGDAEHYRG
jgi:hypothetical protein